MVPTEEATEAESADSEAQVVVPAVRKAQNGKWPGAKDDRLCVFCWFLSLFCTTFHFVKSSIKSFRSRDLDQYPACPAHVSAFCCCLHHVHVSKTRGRACGATSAPHDPVLSEALSGRFSAPLCEGVENDTWVARNATQGYLPSDTTTALTTVGAEDAAEDFDTEMCLFWENAF